MKKPQNIKRFIIQLSSIFIFVTIDAIIKFFIERALAPDGEALIIPGILAFRYAQNTGAAFSFASGNIKLLSFITGVLLIALIFFMFFEKTGNRIYHFCLPLIIGGGIGNLIDRLFRGYVVDYFEFLFFDFAIFNFADCLVTCGAGIMIIYLLYSLFEESNLRKKKTAIAEEACGGED